MTIKHDNFVNTIEVTSYTSKEAKDIQTGLTISNTFDVVVVDTQGNEYGFQVVGDVEEELNKLSI
jgi:flagellar biosynthesis GTPase FlhF